MLDWLGAAAPPTERRLQPDSLLTKMSVTVWETLGKEGEDGVKRVMLVVEEACCEMVTQSRRVQRLDIVSDIWIYEGLGQYMGKYSQGYDWLT